MTHEINEILENGLMNIRATPSTNYVLAGIVNKLYVLIEVKGGEIPQDRPMRNPFDLVLVLDRSGSMFGKKIENAKVAAQQIIKNLRSDDDIHVVQYDDKVEIVFKNGDLKKRDLLIQEIEKIHSGGSKDLMGRLKKGYDLLNSDIGKSNRIFLFSDGLANIGISDPQLIQKAFADMYERRGTNITAFGIGSDFNEGLMAGIAEKSAGDFFFIDNPDKIPGLVGEALDGLLKVISSNTLIKTRGKNGTLVTRMYAHDPKKGAILGDIKESETRQIIIEVEIRPDLLDQSGEFLEIQLEYNMASDLLNNKSNTLVLGITTTTDESKITEEREEVLIARKLMEIAERDSEIIKLIENEKYEDAITVQNQVLDELAGMSGKGFEAVEQRLRMTQLDLNSLKTASERRDETSKSMSMKRKHYSQYVSRQSKQRKDEDE